MSVDNLLHTVDARYGRMAAFTNDIGAVSRSLQTYGEWAENELAFVKLLIPPGAVVVDVGAYIGTHTLAFAQFVCPEGRVISIEPQQKSFEVLKTNVTMNGLQNIQLEYAAAGDHVGALGIPAIDITEEHSFGSASLPRSGSLCSGISAGENSVSEELTPIRLLTIDSLNLTYCALIKIDVEGYEDLVIAGARQTIERLSPAIYAECNSLASAIKTFEIMHKSGYAVHMHVVDAFNPNNFRGVAENIFGPARETALIGVAGSQVRLIDEMTPRPCELILKIETADDLALGMLNKPQYMSEILEVTAAAHTGGDAWLKRARSWCDERDKTRDVAHHALREAHELRDQLEKLRQRFVQLQADLGDARSNGAQLQHKLAELQHNLAEILRSRSWRITKPLRMVKSFAGACGRLWAK